MDFIISNIFFNLFWVYKTVVNTSMLWAFKTLLETRMAGNRCYLTSNVCISGPVKVMKPKIGYLDWPESTDM